MRHARLQLFDGLLRDGLLRQRNVHHDGVGGLFQRVEPPRSSTGLKK